MESMDKLLLRTGFNVLLYYVGIATGYFAGIGKDNLCILVIVIAFVLILCSTLLQGD